MATLAPLILLLWAISIIVQLRVVFLVIAKRHFQTLPLFSVYVALNLFEAAFLFSVYSQFGFTSQAARHTFWHLEPIFQTAKALAAMELLHRVLRHYAGIWALAWRLIAATAVILICYVVASAKQDPDWSLMIANRGYHLTLAVALVSCLLLVRVYSIPLDPLYRSLLGGFCVISCEAVVGSTLVQALFLGHFPNFNDVWNYLQLVIFIGVQVAWAKALRQPARATDRPALLPPSTYDRISSDVNSRLRAINDLLSRFFRAQVLRP